MIYLDNAATSFPKPGEVEKAVADFLDKNGICVRGGLHCAPLAHEKYRSDGAVRVSFGAFNTEKEAKRLLSVLQRLA